MAGPLLPIDPPAFTSARYGLLSVAQPTTPADPHWAGGVQYQALCPSGGTTYDECIVVTGSGGGPTAQPTKADNVDRNNRAATPFTVYTEFDCAPVTFDSGEVNRLAEDSLTRVEEWQVERAFWTGLAGGQTVVFPHLAANAILTAPSGMAGAVSSITLQTAAVIVTGGGTAGPVDVAEGLGVLEQALANCYFGQGVIHIPVSLLPTFVAHGLVYRDGAQLRTWKGNLVVAGGGYTGSSPAGAAPATSSTWIYATGALFAYRSSLISVREVPDSFDRIENTIKAIAERTYVLGWDCCHLATLVSLGGVVTGTGGA